MNEPSGKPRFLICNCENTMNLEASKLEAVLDLDKDFRLYTNLCRTQIEDYQSALQSEHGLCVGCTQESPLFREIALEEERSPPEFVNIRERAGWTKQKGDIHPKIAALLAEAQVPHHPTGLVDVHSEGICLVYGHGQLALDVANQIADRLSVSVILTQSEDAIPPSTVEVPIYTGRIRTATGSLGNFEITVDGYAPMVPSSKETIAFLMTQDGARSSCDLILDLTGESPLFSDHQRRDGYFFVDPRKPADVARSLFEISDMVGTFEKPIYVSYDPDICAHSRSQIVGCSNCIDNCPVSAIQSDGEFVNIDGSVCGGCGNCSSSCPTGAVSYDYPGREELILRIQTLLETYQEAGG
ncbi:MAG: 4Fe-4S dicluster domain-containing protein, partial [Methyloligellaceae bacterium]